MRCEIHNLEMDATTKKVCPLCELNRQPAPSAPDAVWEIVYKVRGGPERDLGDGNSEKYTRPYLTDDTAAALITAHVSKETAALTAKVEELEKKRYDVAVYNLEKIHAAYTQIEVLTAKVERMREVLTECEKIKGFIVAIEQYEEWTDGSPLIGTCRSFYEIKKIAEQCSAALADEEVKSRPEAEGGKPC